MLAKIAFFLYGLASVGCGVFLWWSENKKRKECTVKVDGVVKNAEKWITKKKGKKRKRFCPIFTYRSEEGVEYVRQSNTTSSKPKFSDGQSVTIFYDPNKPERFYVLEEGKAIAITVMLVGFGVMFMLLAPFATMATK